MAITFRLPPDAPDRIAFAYSPLLEAVLSLHVLVEPKHHPLQHPWVRRMRALTPGLRREIEAFAFAFRSYIPNCFSPGATGQLPRIEDDLDALFRLPPATARLEFTRSLDERGLGRDEERVACHPGQRQIRASIAALPAPAQEVAYLALDAPVAFTERFIGMLRDYWQQAFAAEWDRLEPALAESVTAAGRMIARVGPYPLLQTLSPELRVDVSQARFWLAREHDHTIEIGPGEQLLLIPSYYAWPHVRVNCDPPWPLEVVYPAPQLVAAARPPLPPQELVQTLRALADETRLKALRLIAERPRSTQELAPLLAMTEAGLSKHLRVLTQAGLLRRERQGYWVLYGLRRSQLAPFGDALMQFLHALDETPEVPGRET